MTEMEIQIINLLRKGWSYTQIQEHLQVSSKTIAAVKKANFPTTESTTDTLSRDSFQQYPKPPPPVSTIPVEFKPNINPKPKHNKMSTDDNFNDDEDDGSTSKHEVDKLRLQLDHDLEMEKIQAAREQNEREFDLREQELELKREEIAALKRKLEEDKRGLLYRIKILVEDAEDGEYSFEDADTLLESAREVLSDCDQFCFINGITFQGTASHTLLNKLISTLDEFLEDMKEDDSKELEFDASFRRQLSRATFHGF